MTLADKNELHQPPYGDLHGGTWLLAEIWDHLWPWAGRSRRTPHLVQGIGFALALTATVAWVLAALGHLSAGAVIGWWFGWSVFEVEIRRDAKPYVKEGAWWGRVYRRASLADLMCYVAFKNLLVGAVLFLTLKSLGFLLV
jgi:hypothetical protein